MTERRASLVQFGGTEFSFGAPLFAGKQTVAYLNRGTRHGGLSGVSGTTGSVIQCVSHSQDELTHWEVPIRRTYFLSSRALHRATAVDIPSQNRSFSSYE